MTSGLAWLLVGVAVALWPVRAGHHPSEHAPEHVSERVSGRAPGEAHTAPQRDHRPVLIVAVLVVAAVVLLGPLRGAAAAVVLGPAVLGVARLRDRRAGAAPPDRSVALALDLAAAALRGGKPLDAALRVAAPAASAEARADLQRVAGLLRLGADTGQAWARVRDGPLAPVAVVAVRSAASGMRLAAAFERTAAEIRAERAAAAAAGAHRAGISAMAPLAACFLPSFVCLGIVPVVISIARSALGVLP